jgi:ABC-type glutathione transport system ATPase component
MARLRELSLDDLADELPERLPAHANKRLALARALVLDAPLTVLDEIDVGLDRGHAEAMLEAVRNLRERTGGTLLVTTHNLELARALADKLAVLVNGRIIAAGRPVVVLDGVRDAADFDRRFEFSDYTARPRLEDALAAATRRRVHERSTPPARATGASPFGSSTLAGSRTGDVRRMTAGSWPNDEPSTGARGDRRLFWFAVLVALVILGLIVTVRLLSTA